MRSRTFSGPFVASTLQDRFKLGGLVAVLVLVNTAAGGELSNGLGAAAAVFLFNIIYELLLSNKLKQYAMCPVIDLINHSSINTVSFLLEGFWGVLGFRAAGLTCCCWIYRPQQLQNSGSQTVWLGLLSGLG